MDKNPCDLEPLLLKADALVEAAFGAEYRQDPILGELSRMHSIARTVTREHGLLLEEAIAVGLRRSGKIEVSRGIRFPITDAARSLVASNRVETLDRVRLTFDGEARSAFDLDLAAVSTDGSRAWAVDVKRGCGSTSGSRRAQTERELLSVKLLLRSFFRQQGYPVDDVAVAVVDVYGAGGFGSGFTVTRKGVDDFFGVPVLDIIDALEERLRRRLHAAWSDLAASMSGSQGKPVQACAEPESDEDADDTPVASTRSRWGDCFAVGARRSNARTRAGSRVPLVVVRTGRDAEQWSDSPRSREGRSCPER